MEILPIGKRKPYLKLLESMYYPDEEDDEEDEDEDS